MITLNWKNAESLVKPIGIDTTSSNNGVYIRICVSEEKTENDDIKYLYKEAYLTNAEFDEYKLIQSVKDEEITVANIEYLHKLDTPVEYPVNGFTYKPKWAADIYAEKIQQGMVFPALFPLPIYDSTKKEERANNMTMEELTALSMFLAQRQEIYFKEKKQAELEN